MIVVVVVIKLGKTTTISWIIREVHRPELGSDPLSRFISKTTSFADKTLSSRGHEETESLAIVRPHGG
ncbi:hypothetical protein M0804_012737 [Polistes exclamans]|nr:hypothetical protein M0804_012737 [Polistes exclamans]